MAGSPGRIGSALQRIKNTPRWKIRREWQRLQMQLTAPLWLVAPGLVRAAYDRLKRKHLHLWPGEQPPGRDVAIYVIYRPQGLLDSHLLTVNFLQRSGFSVLVVAHHPLSAPDLDRLRAASWKVMTCPNFGYDFGAYREGILHLIDSDLLPENLLVMNDSVWFPVTGDSDLLDQLRGWDEDLRGFCIDHHKRTNNPPFIQSYFFWFGPRLLRSPKFSSWWRRMLMSNNKWLVIRMLEMRMSPYFERNGFSVRARYDHRHIGETLAALDDERFATFLKLQTDRLTGQALAIANTFAACGRQAMTARDYQTLGESSNLEGHVLKHMPDIVLGILNSPMLKKLRMTGYRKQRQMLLASDFQQQVDPIILNEIRGWD